MIVDCREALQDPFCCFVARPAVPSFGFPLSEHSDFGSWKIRIIVVEVFGFLLSKNSDFGNTQAKPTQCQRN